MDRAGMVGADGQTHMGLYDIPYMLAVPNMTVTAPRDGAELVGLLRSALAHDGPFCTRYPRDAVSGAMPPVAEIPAVPYGTWEMLRHGRDCAILAVGVMCDPALAAAELLAKDGLDVSVVNCRFLKPMDLATLEAVLHEHRVLVTVEDGALVNGFGAALAARVAELAPEARVGVLGVPDRTWEHAARAAQLAAAGLTPEGIADKVRQLAQRESFSPA
jgi:1-deoxy-D-xylulose-5-phosphate synthase